MSALGGTFRMNKWGHRSSAVAFFTKDYASNLILKKCSWILVKLLKLSFVLVYKPKK